MNDKLKNEVQTIQLSDMDRKVDLERAITEGYPGAERDIAIVVVQKYFDKFRKKLPEYTRNADNLYKRALANSKYFAINYITQELPDLVERSISFLLLEAEQTGWYRQLEYDNLTDLMSNIYETKKKKGTSEWYDWRFLVEKLFPVAKKLEIDIEDLIGASVQHRKLRDAVPAARTIVDKYENQVFTPEKAADDLKWLMGIVADPSKSADQALIDFDTYRGKVYTLPEVIDGQMFLMPENRTILVIDVTGKETSLVTQALQGRVNFMPSDPKYLFNRITELLGMNGTGGDHGSND